MEIDLYILKLIISFLNIKGCLQIPLVKLWHICCLTRCLWPKFMEDYRIGKISKSVGIPFRSMHFNYLVFTGEGYLEPVRSVLLSCTQIIEMHWLIENRGSYSYRSYMQEECSLSFDIKFNFFLTSRKKLYTLTYSSAGNDRVYQLTITFDEER